METQAEDKSNILKAYCQKLKLVSRVCMPPICKP